jgi:flagellar basal-body rod protein FlgB
LSKIQRIECGGAKSLMELDKSPLFALMGRRMNWLAQRQTLLAHNISNADTPSFKPLDLTKESFHRMLSGTRLTTVSMARTSESHIMPVREPEPFRKDKSRDTYETALAGNSVVLEEQLMKVSETQGAYNLATNLYRKHVSMLKMALGKQQ